MKINCIQTENFQVKKAGDKMLSIHEVTNGQTEQGIYFYTENLDELIIMLNKVKEDME